MRQEELAILHMLLKAPNLAGDQVLLLVTTAILVSRLNRHKTPGKILYDGGSTYSMVRRALTRKLNLPTKHQTLVENRAEVINLEIVLLNRLDIEERVMFF